MKPKVLVAIAVLAVAATVAMFYWRAITLGMIALLALPWLIGFLALATIGFGAFRLRRRKFLKIIWVGFQLALATIVFGIGNAICFRASHRERFVQAAAIRTPNGIQEGMYLPIGGIEQWVQIRGEDRNNPVLLFLHGGPGGSTLPYSSDWRPWEKYFTVVLWDQRGTGRTYRQTGSSVAPTLTLECMTADGIEVAKFLRTHLPQGKIILVGHSWGSMLGIHLIKARPDLFAAYVGTGQTLGRPTIAWKENSPADDAASAGGSKEGRRFPDLANPDLTLLDFYYDYRGFWFSQWKLGGKDGPLQATDLRSLGLDFSVPLFFFEGTRDRVTPIEPAESYFAKIRAPRKEWVQFEGADHFLPLNRPDEFLRELLVRVRPLAVASR